MEASESTTEPTVPTLTPEEVKAGWALVPQRDIDELFGAVKLIGSRVLPSGDAYGHIARCISALRSFVNEGNDAREMAQQAHYPKLDAAADGDEVRMLDPIGLQLKQGQINRRLCKVQLPGKITDDMLPKKLSGKEGAENERGLGNALGVLSPWLYDLTPEKAA